MKNNKLFVLLLMPFVFGLDTNNTTNSTFYITNNQCIFDNVSTNTFCWNITANTSIINISFDQSIQTIDGAIINGSLPVLDVNLSSNEFLNMTYTNSTIQFTCEFIGYAPDFQNPYNRPLQIVNMTYGQSVNDTNITYTCVSFPSINQRIILDEGMNYSYPDSRYNFTLEVNRKPVCPVCTANATTKTLGYNETYYNALCGEQITAPPRPMINENITCDTYDKVVEKTDYGLKLTCNPKPNLQFAIDCGATYTNITSGIEIKTNFANFDENNSCIGSSTFSINGHIYPLCNQTRADVVYLSPEYKIISDNKATNDSIAKGENVNSQNTKDTQELVQMIIGAFVIVLALVVLIIFGYSKYVKKGVENA